MELSWECLFGFSQHYGWGLTERVWRPSIPRTPSRSSMIFMAQPHKSHVFISATLYLQSSHKDLKALGEGEDVEPS